MSDDEIEASNPDSKEGMVHLGGEAHATMLAELHQCVSDTDFEQDEHSKHQEGGRQDEGPGEISLDTASGSTPNEYIPESHVLQATEEFKLCRSHRVIRIKKPSQRKKVLVLFSSGQEKSSNRGSSSIEDSVTQEDMPYPWNRESLNLHYSLLSHWFGVSFADLTCFDVCLHDLS